MGRFVYWMNVSADVLIGRTSNDNGSWVNVTESLHREFNARARDLSLMIQGRVTYEIMDPFWPDARDDESLPDFMREYGEIWTSSPKVLVSSTRTSAEHNTRIVGGPDAIGQLAQIRATTEGDIGVGGANLATQLLRADLLDELMLFTYPVFLGTGRPLFDEPIPADLALVELTRLDGDVVLHRYTVTHPALTP